MKISEGEGCVFVGACKQMCVFLSASVYRLKLNCEKLWEGSMTLNDWPLKQQMELNGDTCDVFCMGR